MVPFLPTLLGLVSLTSQLAAARSHAGQELHPIQHLDALPTKAVIAQMFQWNWDSVAEECKSFLGPAGYGFVQVSPAQEHISGPQWWTDYQPVSYTISSKRGSRTQYQNMIKQCHAAGVGVVADTIFNHMAGIDSGIGVAGNTFTHYNYPVKLHLPRKLLGLLYPEDWERVLHMVAMKRYMALWHAKDVHEFKDVFVDCVDCHHAAFKHGRTLHRDLSVTNLMCDDAPKRRISIVADWDLASLIDDQGEIVVSHAQHRTGTIPFMSRELLTVTPPVHKYWHGLESFLYILLWSAIHFDLENNRHLPPYSKFIRWNDEDLGATCAQKANFFMDPFDSGYYTMLGPELEGPFEWIDALRTLFANAYFAVQLGTTMRRDPNNTAPVISRPTEFFERRITFEPFMSAIGRKPRYPNE